MPTAEEAGLSGYELRVWCMPPDEFTRVFHGDLQRWAKFVRETGLKLE